MTKLLLELERCYVSRVEELHLVEPAANVPHELGRATRGRRLMEGPSHCHVLAHFEPICILTNIFEQPKKSSKTKKQRGFGRTHVSALVVTAVTLVGPTLGDGGELLIPNLQRNLS